MAYKAQLAPPWPRARTAWTIAVLLMLANTLSFVDRQILSLLVEPIKTDLQITDTEIGLLYGLSFTLFYVAAGIPMAYLADRSNRRNIVALSVLVWSVATVLCGLARSYGTLFAARVGVGAGEGGLTPSAHSMLADLFPHERLPTAMGVYQSGTYLGNAMALLIGGILAGLIPPLSVVYLPVLGELKGWHVLFLAVGMPGILLAGLFMLVKEPVRRGVKTAEPHVPVKQLFQHLRRFWVAYTGIIIGFSLMIMVGNGTQFWIPSMVQRKFGWSIPEIGQVFGLISVLCGGSGVIIGGLVASMLGRRTLRGGNLRAAMIGFIALIPLTIAFPLMPTAASTFAMIGAMQFFAGFNFGGGLSALQELTPNRMRARISVIYIISINLLGAMIGPTLIGSLSDSWFADPRKLPQAIAIVSAVGSPLAVLVLWMGMRAYRAALKARPE